MGSSRDSVRRADSFEAWLSDLDQRHERPAPMPWPRAAAAFLWDGQPASHFSRAADLAFQDFVSESPDERTFPPDDVESVASELKLHTARSGAMLKSLRRRFMWDNHPDRRPDLPRDLATRRVAIANMLIDRALKFQASR